MTTVMGPMNYGKSTIHVVKVTRDAGRHELRDLMVDVTLEGDFSEAYMRGDNTGMLATDTMRNTVYALASDHLNMSIESFGITLVRHFQAGSPLVARVQVRIVEYPWSRISAGGQEHDHSFVRAVGERVAIVTGDADALQVQAGIDHVTVLKTTESGWSNFHRDRYTTLPDTEDRILATVITATWTYAEHTDMDFDRNWQNIHSCILETFTDHYSPLVQHTLYRMGNAVLKAHPEVESIHFSLPNKHHLLFDLSRFGAANDNAIFSATDQPYGVIEGTVRR